MQVYNFLNFTYIQGINFLYFNRRLFFYIILWHIFDASVHLTDQLSFDSFEKLEEKHKASLFYYIFKFFFYYFTFDKEENFGIEQNLKLAICTNKAIKGEKTKGPVPVLSHW